MEEKLAYKTLLLRDTQQKLHRLQTEVIDEMKRQIRITDRLNQRLLTQQAQNAKDLKMLLSILKTPRLCTEYHRTIDMQRSTAYTSKQQMEQLRKEDMDCYMYMKEQISEFATEQEFITNFASSIERIHQADQVQPDGLESDIIDLPIKSSNQPANAVPAAKEIQTTKKAQGTTPASQSKRASKSPLRNMAV